MTDTPTLNAIDRHIGSRIRKRRTELGLTMQDLGDQVGISFQQVGKHESSLNRVLARQLYQYGKALKVPISYFFSDFRPKKETA